MREGWSRHEWYAELHQEVRAADDLARHRAAGKKRREGSVRCAPHSARLHAWLCCSPMLCAMTPAVSCVPERLVAGAAAQAAAHSICQIWRLGLVKRALC